MDALSQARFAEHQQLRRVELLRQQIYHQPDPSASPELIETLLEAETELHRLEAERQALEPSSDSGILLDTGGNGQKSDDVLMGEETTGVEVQVLLRQSHIPTGIVHLLDSKATPLVTFRVQYAGEEYVRLRLTSFVEGYSAQAIDTIELTMERNSLEINQFPTFFPDRLQPITELTRATLHICVDNLDGTVEQHNTFPVWLLARTSAYLGLVDPTTGEWVDLTPYLASWVTPNAPEVMKLLCEVADCHPDRSLVGYQTDSTGVESQVKAIFDTLKTLNIHYINSPLCFGITRGEYMQRVRLPSESIANRSANCLDGSVLMASLLEAASISPGIVLVPGHAFLAWDIQAGCYEWDYLETTMVGSHDFAAANQAGRLLADKWRTQAEKLKNPRYFQLLSIAELRVLRGITPMVG